MATPAGLNAFLSTYTEEVFHTLTFIHKEPMTPHERFAVLSTDNGGYVQCLFHDNDMRLYCEAASGFYQYPAPKLSPGRSAPSPHRDSH